MGGCPPKAALSQQRDEFENRLREMQQQLIDSQSESQARQQARQKASESIQKASAQFTLNEELTRVIIDQQLINAGWEADTQEITYKKGARPERGKNKAIAEWPTKGKQSADYILFASLTPIAVVEAKRENIDVAGKIHQAERYSSGFTPGVEM